MYKYIIDTAVGLRQSAPLDKAKYLWLVECYKAGFCGQIHFYNVVRLYY